VIKLKATVEAGVMGSSKVKMRKLFRGSAVHFVSCGAVVSSTNVPLKFVYASLGFDCPETSTNNPLAIFKNVEVALSARKSLIFNLSTSSVIKVTVTVMVKLSGAWLPPANVTISAGAPG
jgi:hypothetical protein